MGIVSSLKKSLQIRESIGVDTIKSQTNELKNLAKDLLTPEKPQHSETFDEALLRLKLTKEDVQKRAVELRKLVYIFSFLSLCLAVYIVYLLYRQAYLASLGSFGILLVLCGQIFRYHFWLYQIHQQRLGCTFREWFQSLGAK